jgi:hypothetical protein
MFVRSLQSSPTRRRGPECTDIDRDDRPVRPHEFRDFLRNRVRTCRTFCAYEHQDGATAKRTLEMPPAIPAPGALIDVAREVLCN